MGKFFKLGLQAPKTMEKNYWMWISIGQQPPDLRDFSRKKLNYF